MVESKSQALSKSDRAQRQSSVGSLKTPSTPRREHALHKAQYFEKRKNYPHENMWVSENTGNRELPSASLQAIKYLLFLTFVFPDFRSQGEKEWHYRRMHTLHANVMN